MTPAIKLACQQKIIHPEPDSYTLELMTMQKLSQNLGELIIDSALHHRPI